MSKIMLTGARPTGPLHLGHYVGTLQEWVKGQAKHNLYIMIADAHLLTTKNSKQEILKIYDNAINMVADCIGVGIDPNKTTFILQSAIPEIIEIAHLLQSFVTVARLSRLPSLKEMNASSGSEMSFALLGYPVLQTADILCLDADLVPVGKDNVAHIEVAREISKRFNRTYQCRSLKIPQTILSERPSLIGLNGSAKMSKSLNNAIYLGDNQEKVYAKVRSMFTDPNRLSADIPGRVDGNPLFEYLDQFGLDAVQVAYYKNRYRLGKVRDSEVKQYLFESIEHFLEPIRLRRQEALVHEDRIRNMIMVGTNQARHKVQQKLQQIKLDMGFNTVHQQIGFQNKNFK